MEGRRGTAHVATHVERKSRYRMAAKLLDKTSQVMATETIKLFHRIPKRYQKTLALDNGKECADFLRIKLKTGLDIYFSEPYAP